LYNSIIVKQAVAFPFGSQAETESIEPKNITSYTFAIIDDIGANGGHSQAKLKQDVRSKNDKSNFFISKRSFSL
jgi:hypothetical protein